MHILYNLYTSMPELDLLVIKSLLKLCPGPLEASSEEKNSQLPTLGYFIIYKESIEHSKISFNMG